MADNTPNLGLRKPEGKDKVGRVTDLNENLVKIDKIAPLSGASDPTTVTPDYIGQTYINTTNGKIFISKSLAEGDWSECDVTLIHAHTNKEVLDAIEEALTTALKTAYDGAVTDKHTHSNKETLDLIEEALTSALKTAYDGAVTNSHSHSNKEVLDAIEESLTSALKTAYDSAVTDSHTHSNKATLDAIQEALTTALKSAYDDAVDKKHANTNDPTADQKAALPGTSGTPSATNKYVTDEEKIVPEKLDLLMGANYFDNFVHKFFWNNTDLWVHTKTGSAGSYVEPLNSQLRTGSTINSTYKLQSQFNYPEQYSCIYEFEMHLSSVSDIDWYIKDGDEEQWTLEAGTNAGTIKFTGGGTTDNITCDMTTDHIFKIALIFGGGGYTKLYLDGVLVADHGGVEAGRITFYIKNTTASEKKLYFRYIHFYWKDL